MVRKCAAFAFALALLVSLGLAMTHPLPAKPIGVSTGDSTPCEPASSAIQASREAKAVSTIHPALAAEIIGQSAGVVSGFRVDAVSPSFPLPAPALYQPLLQRPPPAHS